MWTVSDQSVTRKRRHIHSNSELDDVLWRMLSFRRLVLQYFYHPRVYSVLFYSVTRFFILIRCLLYSTVNKEPSTWYSLYQGHGPFRIRELPGSRLRRLVFCSSDSIPIPMQCSTINPFRNCARPNLRQIGPCRPLQSAGFLRNSVSELIPTFERYYTFPFWRAYQNDIRKISAHTFCGDTWYACCCRKIHDKRVSPCFIYNFLRKI